MKIKKLLLLLLIVVAASQYVIAQDKNDVDLKGVWEFPHGSVLVFQSSDGWNYVGIFEKVNEKWREKGWAKGDLLFKLKREDEGSNVYIGKYRCKYEDDSGEAKECWKSTTITVDGISLNPGNGKKIG